MAPQPQSMVVCGEAHSHAHVRNLQDFSQTTMLAVATLSASSLLVGTPMHDASKQRVVASPKMMPKFLKDAFPNLEKPDFSNVFGGAATAEPIEVKSPNAAINLAGKAMPILGPVFSVEADVQAAVTNLGGYDAELIQSEISSTINSAPVVIYTYGLSPFSTEALSILESTGCKYENVELGAEWFALGPNGSAKRVELRKLYGQGSLPACFIGGEYVGGLTTGADGGLAGLVERDELVPKLRKARAL